MIQLSKRLQTVANYITVGNKVADIGSDHALLPVYLVQSAKCPSVIAGELNEGPWQAARKQIANAGLTSKIDARRGNGLAVLEQNEVDTVTICGMGGVLMSDILTAGLLAGQLEGVNELVLQPNVGEDTVRRWLVDHHWALLDETIIEEDGKIYEVLHAVKSVEAQRLNKQLFSGTHMTLPFNDTMNEAMMFKMGPHLLPKRDKVLLKKWKSELQKLDYIIKSLEQSTLDSAKVKLEATKQEKNHISEVLEWLFTDKQ